MAFLYADVKLGAPYSYHPVVYAPDAIVTPPDPNVPPPVTQVLEVNLKPVPPNTTAGPSDTGPSWVVLCGVCGKRVRAPEARKRWDGVLCCAEDWEARHPLDFIRARKPVHNQAEVPREPGYQFVEAFCPYPQQLAMADIGTADCAAADTSGDLNHVLNH